MLAERNGYTMGLLKPDQDEKIVCREHLDTKTRKRKNKESSFITVSVLLPVSPLTVLKKTKLAGCLEVWSWRPVKGSARWVALCGQRREIRFTNLFINAIWHHRLTRVYTETSKKYESLLEGRYKSDSLFCVFPLRYTLRNKGVNENHQRFLSLSS